MAREYGRYLTKTHRDPDWAKLTTAHHDCFMALASSEDVSWCGVVPYAPARFSGFASDMNERKVERLWAELAALDYLVIDKSTGEILIRTFVRHDNVLAKPNLTKALIAAYLKVRSAVIRSALEGELAKLHQAQPTLAGWRQIAELLPELLPELFAELFPERIGA